MIAQERYREAVAAADAAGQAAGITMSMLRDAEQIHRAVAVLDAIWQKDSSTTVIDAGTLVALAHCGNYVSAALMDEEIVGVCVGFFHRPDKLALHSHIAGVLPHRAGKGIGAAIKLHQRAWAMDAGIGTITWTFDPLVARNAFFNLHRLGATAADYLVDFYGPMTDVINIGQPTDRLLVDWPVAQPSARGVGRRPGTADPGVGTPADGPVVLDVGPDGEPVSRTIPAQPPDRCRVAIPNDIESLRRSDPAAAGSWRIALRDTLQPLLAAGYSIVDFDRSGHYVLANHEEQA